MISNIFNFTYPCQDVYQLYIELSISGPLKWFNLDLCKLLFEDIQGSVFGPFAVLIVYISAQLGDW